MKKHESRREALRRELALLHQEDLEDLEELCTMDDVFFDLYPSRYVEIPERYDRTKTEWGDDSYEPEVEFTEGGLDLLRSLGMRIA